MNNLQQLDEAISRLQTLRQALLHATTPPQVLWCRGGTYCTWVGTTHEAAFQDGEYHCPECGGAENLIIMSQAEAVEFMEECRSMATPWLAGMEQHLQAALDRVAAWKPSSPQVLLCAHCPWVGTTLEASYNAEDNEYRCPQCDSAPHRLAADTAAQVVAQAQGDTLGLLFGNDWRQKIATALATIAQHASTDAFTLRPHTTAELEGLADAFAGAEADFLAQYQHTLCPYCGEETALITPAGRVVCACWTNPAQELVDDLQGEAPVEGSHA